MLPKEIRKEATKYAKGDLKLVAAFISGAQFALTGKYYQEQDFTEEVSNVPTFEEFWNAYAYKKGRKKVEEKWNRLSDEKKIACMKAVPLYIENSCIPCSAYKGERKPYRMHPLTYLNGERWEDEIYPTISDEQHRTYSLAAKAARILSNTDNT